MTVDARDPCRTQGVLASVRQGRAKIRLTFERQFMKLCVEIRGTRMDASALSGDHGNVCDALYILSAHMSAWPETGSDDTSVLMILHLVSVSVSEMEGKYRHTHHSFRSPYTVRRTDTSYAILFFFC